jgi:hypothetical protein
LKVLYGKVEVKVIAFDEKLLLNLLLFSILAFKMLGSGTGSEYEFRISCIRICNADFPD